VGNYGEDLAGGYYSTGEPDIKVYSPNGFATYFLYAKMGIIKQIATTFTKLPLNKAKCTK
jgi:hypothetical protein